jgi:hypothetical protein
MVDKVHGFWRNWSQEILLTIIIGMIAVYYNDFKEDQNYFRVEQKNFNSKLDSVLSLEVNKTSALIMYIKLKDKIDPMLLLTPEKINEEQWEKIRGKSNTRGIIKGGNQSVIDYVPDQTNIATTK